MKKVDSHISKSSSELEAALGGISKKFRTRIILSFFETKGRYFEALHSLNYDSIGLNAGKFAEILLRFLQEELTSTSIPFGQHISNFPDECRKLISLPSTAGNESLRIIIPRGLVFLYTLRGKRGIGHVGGDVEANEIDASAIIRIVDWIICELIRIYHSLSLEEAQGIVNAISTRTVPVIWEIGGRKRILRTDLSFPEKVLLLTYTSTQDGILIEDLFEWVEYSNFSKFKKGILQGLHDQKLIEYDKESGIVYLSPLGVNRVERELLDRKKTTP